MKIVYFGTGEIGLPSLRWLLEAPEVAVAGVVNRILGRLGGTPVSLPDARSGPIRSDAPATTTERGGASGCGGEDVVGLGIFVFFLGTFFALTRFTKSGGTTFSGGGYTSQSDTSTSSWSSGSSYDSSSSYDSGSSSDYGGGGGDFGGGGASDSW